MKPSDDIDLKKLFDFVTDSLIMLCCDLTLVTDEIIKDYLRELEGDTYTFFNLKNLSLLKNDDILSQMQVEMISGLKNVIQNIDTKFWTPNSFRKNLHWQTARKTANDILNSLDIHQRKI